ncbi:hypothetical protein Kpol_376p6 [Vanderwaltozyma polyspora DSM 70294]|uniref:Exocyst complex component Sec8 n=1 Tax=Vanderwaltozyma polyspora (strain ATCC 22028 / DSM 70294 / BCRC 21397 / CBS 2163 / NBRC 10782 / NRRL Y-8283 / UCD 57-17) TaxID=436907 RepID=A7TRV6_VANPO|nr:uncharacterized protein Kpol_376p6 [Vanderwaltozyma polyspora DSM 70294]EDO14993.1 hypothetical protein Kpol_376p6 [Vanderwaltozyma polyspora DSM 70294]
MDHLGVNQQSRRRRALSVNTYTKAQQHTMSNSLDNLDMDLAQVQSQWHRIISNDSNPLELALKFLDETSVGLGHRYTEFNQLKKQIGSDLQAAVNEHYQAFNSNVASYSVAVDSITVAQNNVYNVKKSASEANKKITTQKGSLQELNENTMKHTQMIDILSAIEGLLTIPEKIDDHVRREEYREAQRLLEQSLLLANNHNLWSMPSLLPIKQQLEVSEHNLFQNMIEEIHDIVYSKNSVDILSKNLLGNFDISNSGFTSLESYLYNVVSVDIIQQSENINFKLEKAIKQIKSINPTHLKSTQILIEESSDYDKLFNFLCLINDLNKLPLAMNILLDRSKKELHSIVINSSEELHSKYPSLLKMTSSVSFESDFGISMKNTLSIIMREWFWKIFIKLLIAIQRHRIIYECVASLQLSTSANVSYRFDKIWTKWLNEVKLLLEKYLNNPTISNTNSIRRRGMSVNSNHSKTNMQLFSLQNNLDGSTIAKEHSHELKSLLKDIFPGFSVPGNVDLSSVYIDEESFEEEEALIQPSVFNMKMMLEPCLLLFQATSNILPNEMLEYSIPSMKFLVDYMDKKFFPRVEMTLNYLFETKFLMNSNYTFELNEDNQNVFKSAIDFRNFFFNILFVMHTTYSYRNKICSAIINLLSKYQKNCQDIFQKLLGVTNDDFNRKVVGIWLNNKELMGIEEEFLKDETQSLSSQESALLFNVSNQTLNNGKGIEKSDILNNVDLDAVLHFLNSVMWINEWLPKLRKVIPVDENSQIEKIDAEKLRSEWSLYESVELSTIVRSSTIRLSMDEKTATIFDKITDDFKMLQYKLLTALRFDLRIRCIYYINKLFQTSKDWNPDVGSTELDQNIALLISDIRMFESKLKNNVPEDTREQIFRGIDSINNFSFINGAKSISMINQNGIKKMSRNINYLQNACRNVFGNPSTVDMSGSLCFYTLCGSTEAELFKAIEGKQLEFCNKDDLKTILRLIYGEELQKKVKVHNSTHRRISSLPGTKRFDEANKKIDDLKIKA